MAKRDRSAEHEDGDYVDKRARLDTKTLYNKIATPGNASAVDKNPPLKVLLNVVENGLKTPEKGDAVVYWMRMEDLRIVDNRAISLASQQAERDGIPLVVLFVISPQDYEAHDRSCRRIDFMLRNLKVLKQSLDELNIPLYVVTHKPRRSVPAKVVSLLQEWGASRLFANISYEVDELRRDIKTCEEGKNKGVRCDFIQDKLLVNPGVLTTKNGKAYAVYSPWQRNWLAVLNNNLDWISEAPTPKANSRSIRSSERFRELFQTAIPEFVEGFKCSDKENMTKFWPAGAETAMQMLDRFLHTKARAEQLGEVSPLTGGAETSEKDSRVKRYSDGRNHVDMDTTSRLSPYLASGVVSARACVRHTMSFLECNKVEGSKDNGVGTWVQELAWRDFYNHVMVAFPRVSMGRPYLEKFADVKWEVNEEHLQAWKDGKTGVPIVDAAMRQLKEFGWMHNRCRMIVAMYLTKDLMLDWRLGEQYFMENLIDGDLASNNGGWQWSASTGTDPQPYFRIFNPFSQSEKADPAGNYIRHYVPELAKLKGKDMLSQSRWAPQNPSRSASSSSSKIHNSSSALTAAQYTSLGWSDPALRLIDEVANSMDVDYQAPNSSNSSYQPISIVLDTNVLLRYIEVIQQFAEDVRRAGEPIFIVIPGVVVQELDYQKNDESRDLWWAARRASTWILSKLKEHKHVKGQAFQETLQQSGSWKRRDPGTSNDDLIVDYCLYLREEKAQNVLAISQDNNFCNSAESQGLHTLNPKDFIRWSSKSLARSIFGDVYPNLSLFTDYREIFRHKRVREALNEEANLKPIQTGMDEDGMEVDDDFSASMDPPPQHLLDDLHNQVLEHFGILLTDLLRRISPSLFTSSNNPGTAASIYATASSHKAGAEWEASEILIYLCNRRRLPRSASSDEMRAVVDGSSRMSDFFTQKYHARGRSGQHWSRADWLSSLETLRLVGKVYEDDAIQNSLAQLAPQVELVFQMPMRPTGTSCFGW
ncbi:hypothetical protein DFH11DRAFT_1686509 [Phellopilus nigrolimitatus]|nr:hypothetical protein DFH11DRAFT_1686509 [Phellopilus nigrolimitatus]